MKFKKVMLDDAYLDGKMGFGQYLYKSNNHDSDEFYKSILSDFDNIDYCGVAIDEIIFYILGFFDDYDKEKNERLVRGDEELKLEEEEWVKKLMCRTGVSNIDDLGAAMVSNLILELDNIYIDSRDVRDFIEERIDKKSTYVKKKLEETSYGDWVKLRAKERRRRK